METREPRKDLENRTEQEDKFDKGYGCLLALVGAGLIGVAIFAFYSDAKTKAQKEAMRIQEEKIKARYTFQVNERDVGFGAGDERYIINNGETFYSKINREPIELYFGLKGGNE